MHLELSTPVQQFIQQQIASGIYSDEAELVTIAIQRLQEEALEPVDTESAFYKEVMKGVADVEAGRVKPWTPELMDQLFDRAVENVKNGKPLEPSAALPRHA